VSYAADCFEALQGAEAAILVTAWPEYRAITAWHLKRLMKQPVVVDGRAFFDRKIFEEEGVRWIGIGYREP
jgi:UDP-glucose 6-dehydrogenase